MTVAQWQSAGPDNTGMTISNGGINASESSLAYSGVRANISKATGKFYWEYKVVACGDASDIYLGCGTSGGTLNSFGGNGAYRIMWRGGSGQVFADGGEVTTAPERTTFGLNAILGFHVDFTTGNFWCNLNGGAMIKGGDPAAGTTPTGTFTTGTIFPTYLSDNITATICEVMMKAAPVLLSSTPASGFSPLGDNPLITQAITAGAMSSMLGKLVNAKCLTTITVRAMSSMVGRSFTFNVMAAYNWIIKARRRTKR